MTVLLSALAFTQESRYGTVTSTYLGGPRRARVLVAKWLSLAIASVVITTATLAVSVTFGIALIRFRDGDVTVAAQFWGVVVAGFDVLATFGRPHMTVCSHRWIRPSSWSICLACRSPTPGMVRRGIEGEVTRDDDR